jgi:large subunit ribosomal protein L9
MALVMGEMIRARFPGDWCIGAASLISGVVSILLLVALLGDQDTTVKEFFEKQIRAHFQQSLETFETTGENKAEVADIKAFVEKTVSGFASTYPAFVLIGSLVSAMVNYGLLRIVWRRFYGPGLFSERTFAEWVCPENLVWGFIASSAALFLGQGMVADVGLNIFVVMLIIYFAQGMSVVIHFLKARKVPVFLWVALFILIFAQPLFIGLVAGIGVFDIWVDFRKIRNPLPSEDVDGLGFCGDEVEVKDGYGRNFLIPKGKALLATPNNLKAFNHQKRIVQAKVKKVTGIAQEVADKISAATIQIKKKMGDGGKMFGAVTAQEISDLLKAKGIEIDRRKIQIQEPIKKAGEYSIPVKLHPEVIAQIKLTVEGEKVVEKTEEKAEGETEAAEADEAAEAVEKSEEKEAE